MSSIESSSSSRAPVKDMEQVSDQLVDILKRQIIWNRTFSEISSLEKEIHRQLTEFMRKQTEYMEVVNDLLDCILTGELNLDITMYTKIEAKYKVVEHSVSYFKLKLDRVSKAVKKWRVVWVDEFFLDQKQFVGESAEKRNAVIQRCKEGNRVAGKAKLMMHNLTVQWSVLEVDMEERLTNSMQKVEDLLVDKLMLSSPMESLSPAWKERVTKALRRRALETMKKKPDETQNPKLEKENTSKD